MAEQLALFDASPAKTQVTIDEKKKRNWENCFQRWSDNQSSSSEGKSFGCCGFKMTNGDWFRSLTNEQIAAFIAHERWNMAKPVFETFGYGITEEFLFAKLLKWVNEECEETDVQIIHSATQKDDEKPKV